MNPKGPLLSVAGLTKVFRIGRFPRTRLIRALSGVDLVVGEGEVVGLVGESGSGKSTLARILARLERPTSGVVELMGIRLPPGALARRSLLAYRKQVQMIFQDPYASLNPVHPVGYTLARPLVVHGMARGRAAAERVEQLLERCGLTPGHRFVGRYPHELSGGQRQRVGIARALAVEPRLLLADEPTSMLDVSVRLDIMNLLLDLRAGQGLSILFITHDLAAARYMCDRVAVLYRGHLVEVGPADALIQEPRHPYTQLLRRAVPDPGAGSGLQPLSAAVEPADLTDAPPGCPFEPRCPVARPSCRDGLPAMVEVAPGHRVRCVLYA